MNARLRATVLAAGEALIALAALFAAVAGWRRDFRMPIYFRYDALEYLMQVGAGEYLVSIRILAADRSCVYAGPSTPVIAR
jgi:hypothetical protein